VAEKFGSKKDARYLSWYATDLRIKNILPHRKIGGLMYYKYQDILRLLEGGEEKSAMEKQLEQLSCFINRVASDGRLKLTHTSLYLALCDSWIGSRFSNTFHVSRRKLMRAAHIQSIVTYHKVIGELQAFGYLHYLPSYNPTKGSRISLLVP
jgi:hypothetical protein